LPNCPVALSPCHLVTLSPCNSVTVFYYLYPNINPMDIHQTTTAFDIAGYKVVRNLGVVRGIIVRSRSIFGTIGASLQTIVGGDITLFTELCEKTRRDAFNLMLEHASEVGANAVIGVRYESTEVMSGVTEVICYGTAVVTDPV
jgi:uncharacterized protein YbjQ (UPF0145 family)